MEEKPESASAFKVSTYDWSVRLFRILKKLLSVNIKLHHDAGQVESGDIFLFNHFSRFETFIPQYLIYEATGSYCYSVAHAEFFANEDSAFTNYLNSVGVIPHNHPQLFSLLAKAILHGNKVVIFPEGGMVKDRNVIDEHGHYKVYSRSADVRRKQHTGSAVLAMGLDAFKSAVKHSDKKGKREQLQHWCDQLDFAHVDQLLEACQRPTEIVPANITFYPLRINDNILLRGSELLSKGLSLRASEELLIEGNILLKDTDMDVRLGNPIHPADYWRWWEQVLSRHISPKMDELEDFFYFTEHPDSIYKKLFSHSIYQHAAKVRDDYMVGMYEATTVNLSHIASALIMQLLREGIFDINRDVFHHACYLAIKKIQKQSGAHLHRTLTNPVFYKDLAKGNSKELEQFLELAGLAQLIRLSEKRYHFQPKLLDEHAFDEIRRENPVAVYSNEVAPLRYLQTCIQAALAEGRHIDKKQLATCFFDDQVLAYVNDKARFAQDKYLEINAKESATADPSPFLLFPQKETGAAVVTVHGFLASPAEVIGFGEYLAQHGYIAIGPRLAGHGTSPADLRERHYEEWLDDGRRAITIAQGYADYVFLSGFSTGGALALHVASENPTRLCGTAAISVPIRFQDKAMMLVPLVHGVNQIAQLLSFREGVKPYLDNVPEHANINYRSIPLHGLNELRKLIADLQPRLKLIEKPVSVFQGDRDPVVAPESAQIIYDQLQVKDKMLELIPSETHGILYQNTNMLHDKLLAFFNNHLHTATQ